MGDESLTFNGINGATGEYLLPRLAPKLLAQIALNELPQRFQHLRELRSRSKRGAATTGSGMGVDPKDLGQTGWGLIMEAGADRAILGALAPLRELRNAQVGSGGGMGAYQEFVGDLGVRPGESGDEFLMRHGSGPGIVSPARVPYYLLVVGDPESVSYSFQSQLGLQYAVGRISFDTPNGYARYAEGVVAAEAGTAFLPRRAVFFGTSHPGDWSTVPSATKLFDQIVLEAGARASGWELQSLIGDAATKNAMGRLLGGEETPAVLFMSAHGMAFPSAHPLQRPHQGALLCQEWPGPMQWEGPIPPSYYFSGDDLDVDARLSGLIAFCLASFGAGSPRHSGLPDQELYAQVLPGQAFVARLAQRLLGHPNGGALALVGQVGPAWGFSFEQEEMGRELQLLRRILLRLLEQYPIGAALEYLTQRSAELSSDLSYELDQVRNYGRPPVDDELAQLWTASNDARSFVIAGDPAVRL